MPIAEREKITAVRPVTLSDVLEDGVFAGVIGAVIVAVWFLIRDLIHGHALMTPALLGTLVLEGPRAMDAMRTITPQAVAVYTGIHFFAFLAIGVIAAYLWALFEHYPMVGFVMVVGFIAFEVGFFALDFAVGGKILGHLGAVSVGVGNLLAALGMGSYLFFRHPQAMKGMSRLWDEE